MDPRPDPPPPGPPASRLPAVPNPPPTSGWPRPARPGPRFAWRRLARSPRGASCLAVVVAALLLWPFAGFSWIPWLVGLGALVVLRLLRLDGPLRGWDFPLAGLVVVVGLMLSTGPWAWALAGSIGVLLAGLAQLPWWRLAAVGAVLCVVSGVGYGLALHQERVELEQIQARAGDLSRAGIAEESEDILEALILAISQSRPDPDLLCALMTPAAEQQLAAAAGSADCLQAAALLHGRYRPTAPAASERPGPSVADRSQPPPATLVLDGCATAWATTAGPQVGRVHVDLVDPNQRTYLVTGFLPCP